MLRIYRNTSSLGMCMFDVAVCHTSLKSFLDTRFFVIFLQTWPCALKTGTSLFLLSKHVRLFFLFLTGSAGHISVEGPQCWGLTLNRHPVGVSEIVLPDTDRLVFSPRKKPTWAAIWLGWALGIGASATFCWVRNMWSPSAVFRHPSFGPLSRLLKRKWVFCLISRAVFVFTVEEKG